MRINSRKVRKILGRIWTAPTRIFETPCTQEALSTHSIIYLKTNKGFPYTIFPVKKINVKNILKL
jgi:hypothetical protein